MSNVFYGADGRFYNISPAGLSMSNEHHQAPSSLSISASAGMLSLDDMAESPPELTAPSAATGSHLRLDLTEALKVLGLDERAAIILCCQNGLSHEEAALVLDCPLGTVKTNIMRGKEKTESTFERHH